MSTVTTMRADDERLSDRLLEVTQAAVSKGGGEANIIALPGGFKQDVLNPFVIVFNRNMLQLLKDKELQLGINEMKVIFQLCEYAEFGNLLNVSQKKLARDLSIDTSSVSRAMKKLTSKGILISDAEAEGEEGNLYLNPQIITKGALHKIDKQLFDKSKKTCKEKQLQMGFDFAKKDKKS